LCDDILESGGGDNRRGGLEEGAAVDGHGRMIRRGLGIENQKNGDKGYCATAKPRDRRSELGGRST
jgi:hypothetical protein